MFMPVIDTDRFSVCIIYISFNFQKVIKQKFQKPVIWTAIMQIGMKY